MQDENTTKPKLSVGFFFINLGSIITLIVSVVAFLNIVFETLNKKYPDILNATYNYGYYSYELESLKTSIAILLIFFPVFMLLTYFWKKHSRGVMSSIDILIKKWMVYLIIFLSSGMFMITLTMLIKYFISGELTTRFSLKVLAVFITALLVGKFYIFDLLNNKVFGIEIKSSNKIFAITAMILVILAVWCSFSVIGSPKEQRLLRIDAKKIEDLTNIQYQLINFWQQKEKLPESLSELNNPMVGYTLPKDPEFEAGKSYEYILKNKDTFELCADFNLPSREGWQENGGIRPMFTEPMMDVSVSYPSKIINDSWAHDLGRSCFERKIDKDIYPPFNKK
ncbi:MAG: DUF5671 domain-containing protein [Candidatus Pacebacteria bacterium]|nr:DUF5671 domain-containing protein [Candidatus Paceibacterota bacterium]MCF7863096.1 DUF5671 domain-containing protein [Candidatus Paceibacterota bacterium]